MAYKENGNILISDGGALTANVVIANSSVTANSLKINSESPAAARGKILVSDGVDGFIWADELYEKIKFATTGYASGGIIPPAPVNTIDSFPFNTPFTTGTDVGDLSQARRSLSGQSSSTDGYASGGGTPSYSSVIDEFPFSSPFTTATASGDLSLGRYSLCGQSSDTAGYSSGGTTTPPFTYSTLIESFPFSTPFTTATDAGDLSQERNTAVGQSSSSDGYTSGGFAPAVPTAIRLTTIDRFPFSTPFTTASDVGDLSQARQTAAGQSSSSNGYTSGGYVPPQVVTIDSFPFSTPFTTATDAGDLSQSRSGAAGQSSSSDGYTSGGSPPLVGLNTIDSFPFSTPFTTATDAGNLNQSRRNLTGQQG